MATIIESVILNNETVDLKTKRSIISMEINPSKEFIKVYYKESTYYEKLGEEIETKSEIKSYDGDFQVWKASQTGADITSALVTQINKQVPGQ